MKMVKALEDRVDWAHKELATRSDCYQVMLAEVMDHIAQIIYILQYYRRESERAQLQIQLLIDHYQNMIGGGTIDRALVQSFE